MVSRLRVLGCGAVCFAFLITGLPVYAQRVHPGVFHPGDVLKASVEFERSTDAKITFLQLEFDVSSNIAEPGQKDFPGQFWCDYDVAAKNGSSFRFNCKVPSNASTGDYAIRFITARFGPPYSLQIRYAQPNDFTSPVIHIENVLRLDRPRIKAVKVLPEKP